MGCGRHFKSMPSILSAKPIREVPAASCARYNMMIFLASACDAVGAPIGREMDIAAGLKVPADSQPVPSGERIGASEARSHAPNGSCCGTAAKIIADAAKPSAAAEHQSASNIL